MAPKLATEVDFTLSDGKKIPALGLGTVPPKDPSELQAQVITAVKAGYRHIDTAWVYGTEKYIGEALKQLFDEGVVKREDLFITTKCWPSYALNPEKSLDESLAALGIDYVDLFLQHWPAVFKSDENGQPLRPTDSEGNVMLADDPKAFITFYNRIEDILENTTKARSIGVSNYSIDLLDELLQNVKKHKPVVNQIEYHPLLPHQDLIEFSAKNGVHITAFSPVGSTGAPIIKIPLVQQLAEKYNVTTNEIANAYHILQGRSTLPRSSNLERIKTIIRLPELTKGELAQLYQLGVDNPKSFVTFFPWDKSFKFSWEKIAK